MIIINKEMESMKAEFDKAISVYKEISEYRKKDIAKRVSIKEELDKKDNYPRFKLTQAKRFLNGGHFKDFTACMLNISKKDVSKDKYMQARELFDKLVKLKDSKDGQNSELIELNRKISTYNSLLILDTEIIKLIMQDILSHAINEVSKKVKYKVIHAGFYNRIEGYTGDRFIIGSASNKHNEPYYSLTFIDGCIRISVNADVSNVDDKGRLSKPLTIKNIKALDKLELWARHDGIEKEREKMKELERQLDNSRMAISKLSLGLYNE